MSVYATKAAMIGCLCLWISNLSVRSWERPGRSSSPCWCFARSRFSFSFPLLGAFSQRQHHPTACVGQTACWLRLLCVRSTCCGLLLPCGCILCRLSGRKRSVAGCFADPAAGEHRSRLRNLCGRQRLRQLQGYVRLVFLDVIVGGCELEFISSCADHFRRMLRTAHRNPFAVQERPHSICVLLIARAEHEEPVPIGHLRDVGILLHDRVSKLAGRRRGRSRRDGESGRRSGGVLGCLKHLIPAIGAAVILLVVILREFINLLLRRRIVRGKIHSASSVKESVDVVGRIRLQIGRGERINILQVIRIFRYCNRCGKRLLSVRKVFILKSAHSDSAVEDNLYSILQLREIGIRNACRSWHRVSRLQSTLTILSCLAVHLRCLLRIRLLCCL